MDPNQRPQAIFKDVGSSFRPSDGIGMAYNQSEAFSEDTARIRAFSTLQEKEV